MFQKKKLIIVYSEGLDKYANYLMQLISSRDDGDSIVGVPDGSVEAAIWGEKEYESSVHSLSSSTFIIFVGDGPIAMRARANMTWRIDELGMHFGWLGTQACMYVDDALNRENYGEFVKRCEEYGQTFHGGIGPLEGYQKDDEPITLRAEDVIIEQVDESKPADDKSGRTPNLASDKWRAIMRGENDPEVITSDVVNNASRRDATPTENSLDLFGIVTTPFRAIAEALDVAGANLAAFVSSGESRDRQYTLLARIVYIGCLSEFMGV